MKKLFSSVLSFLFLFNTFIPAFAADCNYKGMLKSRSNPSWLDSECVINLACKYLPSKNDDRLKVMGDGIDYYRGYWFPRWNDLTEAEQNKVLTAVHTFVAGFGFNGYTTVMLPSGETETRAMTKEEMVSSRLERQRVCATISTDNGNNQNRPAHKAFIPDLKYINAEIMYPSEGTGGEPCKDMKEFEALLKNKIKEVHAQGKHCRESGDCDFDIHKVVKSMLDKSNNAKCDENFYLTNQNLRYLFLVYAALINNSSGDINKLLLYINGNYPERVKAAAANAAMAFSKYTFYVDGGSKMANTPLGTLEYNEKQREVIAAEVSLEYMRAGLSDAGYNLYKQNIDRLIKGYDKSDLVIVDQNGNALQKASMPVFAVAMLLNAAGGMAQDGSIAIEISEYGSAVIRHLKTPITIDLSRIGTLARSAVVIESSTLGVLLGALSIPAATIFELNNAFEGSYLRAKKDSVNKYMSQLIDSSTTALANFEYVYSRDIPIGVMEMVRGTDKITISKSKADTWEITLDRTNPNRVTCREINTAPIITEYCMNNLNQCIKTQYLNTENAKSLLEASGYSDPSFQKALKYEDRIASTKYPSQPLTWRVVHNPLTGGWTPYGELPISLGEVSKGDLIKITSQFTKDEVYEIFKGVFNGGIKLTCNGTTIRIGADEMQPGTSRGEPNTHLHFEEIQYFKDAQPYICNHAVYFLMPPAGNKNLNIGHYLEMLWKIFY
ncbi:MAG: hypothetical protein PUB86_05825 [Elusimicrobia bacterium]|nr:hypothetical protein [Elusimicrobiota bacterium]